MIHFKPLFIHVNEEVENMTSHDIMGYDMIWIHLHIMHISPLYRGYMQGIQGYTQPQCLHYPISWDTGYIRGYGSMDPKILDPGISGDPRK